jgi:hypothetical protein
MAPDVQLNLHVACGASELKRRLDFDSQRMRVVETVSLLSVLISLSSQVTMSVIGSHRAESIASTASTSQMEPSSSFTIPLGHGFVRAITERASFSWQLNYILGLYRSLFGLLQAVLGFECATRSCLDAGAAGEPGGVCSESILSASAPLSSSLTA